MPDPSPSALPSVQGRCPSCGGSSLFLGVGGYVTCSWVDCPEPDAASTLLERDPRTAPTCGLVTPGIGATPLGPCIREPHEDMVHKAANGARWWPVDGGAHWFPPDITEQEIADIRARWAANTGRPVVVNITNGVGR